MDSSSDESFAWTDASDDTTDNETMAKTNLSSSQSGEESESGKSYKKKLQQRLFSETGREDISSGTDTSTDRSRPRKRKLAEQQPELDNSCSLKEKQVKLEPESDVETVKRKKYKSINKQGNPNDQYDESFLDSKVKNEECFAVPTPVKSKKKRKKSISNSNGDIDESNLSNSQSISEELSAPDVSGEENTKGHINFTESKSKNKKHKKKAHKRSTSSEKEGNMTTSVPEDQIEAETEDRYNPSLADESLDGFHKNICNTINSQRDAQRETETIRIVSVNSSILHPKSVSLSEKRKSRMSERIQFEDEEDSDVQIQANKNKTPNKSTENYKKKLRSYIESSVNLRPFHLKLESPFLTDHDDLWVVKCPKEVKPESFQDKKWVLDSKCKIKLDGQTYEGQVGDTKSNMTIVCIAENNKVVIKNVQVNGCIRLHKRLPKALVHEDNIIVNNQTNFIPLPDTKCRHPLFGLNYKKAMKLPSAVVERLQAASAAVSGHKRSKRDRASMNGKLEHVVDSTGYDEYLTQSMITSKKKKKKRKLSNTGTEEESIPRPKRSKHDLESADAWESEKTIEENLFNF